MDRQHGILTAEADVAERPGASLGCAGEHRLELGLGQADSARLEIGSLR
jgi:hypothetical protein